MVNASTSRPMTCPVLRPSCPLLSAFPRMPNIPAAPSSRAAPAHPSRASAAPLPALPPAAPLSPCAIPRSCLGSARGVLPAGPGLSPSGLHVLRQQQSTGTGASAAGMGSPPTNTQEMLAAWLGPGCLLGWGWSQPWLSQQHSCGIWPAQR